MSKQAKLLNKFLATPIKRDLTYAELKTLLESLGYQEREGSGSRVSFYHAILDDMIDLHKPHPNNELKLYQVKQVQKKLHEILPLLKEKPSSDDMR